MANNQQLPRPNLPNDSSKQQSNPPQKGGAKQAAQPSASQQQTRPSNQNQAAQKPANNPQASNITPPSKPKPPAGKPQPTLATRPQPINQQQSQTTASTPAGLDPNSPGGAPPALDEKGRAKGSSAQISAVRERQKFGRSTAAGLNRSQLADNVSPTPKNEQQPGLSGLAGLASKDSDSDAKKQKSQVGSDKTLAYTGTRQKGSPTQSVQQPSVPSSKPRISGTAKGGSSSIPKQAARFPTSGKKNSLQKYLPFALGAGALLGLVLLAVFLFGGGGGDGGGPTSSGEAPNGEAPAVGDGKPITLTYWGLWEPNAVLDDVFTDFKQQYPNITIDYRQQSHKDYRTRLQNQIATGGGPDIFRYHATWVPMLEEELAAMPTSVMSSAEFEEAFYPIAKDQLQANGHIVGVPLMYEGLGLYYNKEILDSANKEVPSTWAELQLLAAALTEYDQDSGNMLRGGLAIGNTSNVEHWPDILGLLIFQNGGNPSNPVSTEVRDAMRFYASFNQAKDGKPVFDETLPSATVAFAREELAMMFAPSWRAHEVKDMNASLDFGIVPVPKLSESGYGWASYWAEGVSSKSKNQEAAWQLLQYLSSEEVMKKLYSEQSEIRAFGEIYPRRDLAEEVESDLTTAYLLDAPRAKSWYLCSYTHDKGINDRMIDYYQSALNEYIKGTTQDQVLEDLSQGVGQILRQYGIE